MSLRRKNFIAIISTLIGLVIVLFAVSQFIILRQFDEQQQEAVHLNMDRARIALDHELDNLSSITSDWAYWDDTYQFVQNHNQTYIDSNLTDDTLDNLNLDFMVFIDRQNEIVFNKMRDIQGETAFDIQPDMMRRLLDFPEHTDVNKGIVLLTQAPVLVASRAILNSIKTGTPQGTLIIGRYLNQATIDEMSQQTQLSLTLNRFDAPQAAAGFQTAKSILSNSQSPTLYYAVKNQVAEGYSLLNDMLDKPILIIQVESPNRIYQAGEQAVGYILVTLLIAGLVFGIVILWLSEHIVISRLAYMDNRIAEISRSNDLSARISMSGNDELARLAATINESLAKREQSQEDQFRELNTTLNRVNAELQEKIADLNANQKYKDRFFAHASHEFRTPLAIMRTRLYLARRKPDLWEGHIDSLEETLGRLLNVIDDIFDMTKLQDHNLTLNRQKVDLKSFTMMILEGMSAQFTNAGMKVRQEFSEEALSVSVDFIYLGRAYNKLINFVLDSSQPDSEIVVSLQKQDAAGKSVAVITMGSTALNFKAEEMSQMFSPFYQVSEGNIQNTGLNLAIAQRILQVHEGTLTAANDPIKGGQFQMTLPLIAPRQQ